MWTLGDTRLHWGWDGWSRMQVEASPLSLSDQVRARLSWSSSNTYVAAVVCRVPRVRRKVGHPAACEWGGQHVLGPGAVETARGRA